MGGLGSGSSSTTSALAGVDGLSGGRRRSRVGYVRQHRGAGPCLRRRGKKTAGGQALGRSRGALYPGLQPDDALLGTFLALNTWVDLRTSLDEPEPLARLIVAAQASEVVVAPQARERVVAAGRRSFKAKEGTTTLMAATISMIVRHGSMGGRDG